MPIVVLSARQDGEDKVDALDAGGCSATDRTCRSARRNGQSSRSSRPASPVALPNPRCGRRPAWPSLEPGSRLAAPRGPSPNTLSTCSEGVCWANVRSVWPPPGGWPLQVELEQMRALPHAVVANRPPSCQEPTGRPRPAGSGVAMASRDTVRGWGQGLVRRARARGRAVSTDPVDDARVNPTDSCPSDYDPGATKSANATMLSS
jgi:hypothetical protein